MRKLIIHSFMLLLPAILFAQEKNRFQSLDFAAAFGKSQGTASVSGWNHWYTGKNKRLALGIGARFSAYAGTKKDFITAPADLARGSAVPFLVVVSSQESQNWDTLSIQQPRLFSLNAAVSAIYQFTPKFSAGFNIDLIGFTLGKKSGAVFTSEGQTQTTTAKPASFNVLLTGDLDYGSLNSEFYLAYKVNKNLTLRGLYQFYFAEYTTPGNIQVSPKPNDRFRNKANLLGLGLTWHFNRSL